MKKKNDEENSVLHVAASLDDYNAFHLASLRMQWEIKWFKVYSSFSIGLILGKKKSVQTLKGNLCFTFKHA